ncbi:MAG: PilZ domain-containing protein [Omnitrophica bacterium]|nr:PilZ domain-containing protein [Candidatus Omnitrophota bacterium]
MIRERRSEKRVKAQVAVRIPAFGMALRHPVNICPSGLSVISSVFLDVNHEFDMELIVQGKDSIYTRARVMWIDPKRKGAGCYRVGMKFMDLGPEDKKRLQADLQ